MKEIKKDRRKETKDDGEKERKNDGCSTEPLECPLVTRAARSRSSPFPPPLSSRPSHSARPALAGRRAACEQSRAASVQMAPC